MPNQVLFIAESYNIPYLIWRKTNRRETNNCLDFSYLTYIILVFQNQIVSGNVSTIITSLETFFPRVLCFPFSGLVALLGHFTVFILGHKFLMILGMSPGLDSLFPGSGVLFFLGLLPLFFVWFFCHFFFLIYRICAFLSNIRKNQQDVHPRPLPPVSLPIPPI